MLRNITLSHEIGCILWESGLSC